MKAFIKSKCKTVAILAVFLAPLLVSLQANAHYHHKHWRYLHEMYSQEWAYYPAALCSAYATGAVIPAYSCCELLKRTKHGVHHVWRDTWVSGSCKNANTYARGDMGCTIESPVYGTNSPITASCQYSYSTGRFE